MAKDSKGTVIVEGDEVFIRAVVKTIQEDNHAGDALIVTRTVEKHAPYPDGTIINIHSSQVIKAVNFGTIEPNLETGHVPSDSTGQVPAVNTAAEKNEKPPEDPGKSKPGDVAPQETKVSGPTVPQQPSAPTVKPQNLQGR